MGIPRASLAALLARSSKRSPYFDKDLAKARRATLFVGQGSAFSSTQAYADAAGALANVGSYGSNDVVFVSAEGARRGRHAAVVDGVPQGAYADLVPVVEAGATVIVDVPADRARPYNVGEREVATFLTESGYRETAPGTFSPSAQDPVDPETNVPLQGVMPRPVPRFRGGPLPPAMPHATRRT